jgi:hypothetical protein
VKFEIEISGPLVSTRYEIAYIIYNALRARGFVGTILGIDDKHPKRSALLRDDQILIVEAISDG